MAARSPNPSKKPYKTAPREGTVVIFNPRPASLVLYTNPPRVGEQGVVRAVSTGRGKATFMPGPGGGLLYVTWDQTGPQGVSLLDVARPTYRENRARDSRTSSIGKLEKSWVGRKEHDARWATSGHAPHVTLRKDNPACGCSAPGARMGNPHGHFLDVLVGDADTVFLDGTPIARVGDGNASWHDSDHGKVLRLRWHDREYTSGVVAYGLPRPTPIHLISGPKVAGRRANPADPHAVAETIIAQLGGRGKLMSMIGAYDFTYGPGPGRLSFKWRAPSPANVAQITLEPSDTYHVQLFKYRGKSLKPVYEAHGVHAAQIAPLFEQHTGLRLNLGAAPAPRGANPTKRSRAKAHESLWLKETPGQQIRLSPRYDNYEHFHDYEHFHSGIDRYEGSEDARKRTFVVRWMPINELLSQVYFDDDDIEESNAFIADVADRMKRGEDIPPAIVSKDGQLEDGGHRIESARRLGISKVPVITIGDPFAAKSARKGNPTKRPRPSAAVHPALQPIAKAELGRACFQPKCFVTPPTSSIPLLPPHRPLPALPRARRR